MATTEQLYDALRKADAAGNTDDARALAAAIKAQAPPEDPGVVRNYLAGLNKGIAGLAGAPVDAVNWAGSHNLIDMGVNAVGHALGHKGDVLPDLSSKLAIHEPVLGSDWIKHKVFAPVGVDTDNVAAPTLIDRLAQSAGAGTSGALAGPGGEAGALRSIATNTAMGAGAGAAQEAAPNWLKPAATMAGALATGHALDAGARLAPKIATKVRSATDPVAASMSDAAARRMAARRVTQAATDPDLALSTLGQGHPELVHGSEPTTFQLTGDMGLGALERSASNRNPDLFNQRRAEQNSARLNVLGGIENNGNPNDLANYFRSQMRGFDQNLQAEIDALGSKARSSVTAIGGVKPAEAHGAAVRQVVQDAEDRARAFEHGLWTAVDPHGELTGNMTETATAAKDIAGKMAKAAKPMEGEEKEIFQSAQGLPPLSPVSELIALRSRLSTEMRIELGKNGRSPAYGRLSQLRGAIQDNLSNSIAHQVANDDAAVARGAIAPEDSAAARVQSWQNDFYAEKARADSAGGNGGIAAGRATEAIGPHGAAFSRPGGSGSASGDQGLSPDAPTFDAEAASRLKAATAATRERATTFGVAPVKAAIQKAGTQDVYRLPEASVPQKFFHPGPTGFQDMQSLYKAVGEESAIPLMTDFAASSLRRAALRDDGTIDPRRYATWASQHADALRALPSQVKSQFADAASASEAVANAAKSRQAALSEMEKGAIARVMNAESGDAVTKTIGNLLGTQNATAEMQRIANAAAKDPYAMRGLRQSVADYMQRKFISNTEAATSGEDVIRSDQLQTFLRNNRPALSTVFSPSEMDSLNAIARDLKRSNRSITAVKLPGGSNTAQDLYAVRKDTPVSNLRRFAIDLGFGGLVGLHSGTAAGIAVGLGAHGIQLLRNAGIENANQLITRAMLDPELAKELLVKTPARGTLPRSLVNKLKSMATTSVAVSSTRGDNAP